MRKCLNYIAVGLLGLVTVAGHAASPSLFVTAEDLRNLRSTSVLSKLGTEEPNTSPTQPGGPAPDSDFSKKFREALATEEKANQAVREQQSARDRQHQMERINESVRRSGKSPSRLSQPEIQDGNVGISFGTNGSAVTSCRENEFGKIQCGARELR